MSLENVKNYLKKFGLDDKILKFDISSATVSLAAEAVGTTPDRIAKSLTFIVDDNPIMIVCSGDMKIDNSKFKAQFHTKPKMIAFDDVENLVGHQVGGVCPFAIKENVKVYLDVSLNRFDYIYPACGSSNSAIKLDNESLKNISQNFLGYVDVCKMIEN